MATRRNQFIDQRTLDRLVDDELDEAQRRAAIVQLDAEPDGWKRCALAFLESQSIGRELVQYAAGSNPHEASYPAGAAGASFGVKSVAVKASHAQQPRPGGLNSSHGASGWALRLAMAACLLIAFTLGRHASEQTTPSPAMSPLASNDQQATESPAPYAFGEPQTMVKYNPKWDLFQGQSALPPDIEGALRQMGFSIERQSGLMPVTDVSGNRMILPFEDVKLVPAAHNIR